MLEAEGTVEIKYRQKDVCATIRRLDAVCNQFQERLSDPEISRDEKQQLEAQLKVTSLRLDPRGEDFQTQKMCHAKNKIRKLVPYSAM